MQFTEEHITKSLLKHFSWEEIPYQTHTPSPRHLHTAILVGGCLIFVFGGYGEKGPLNDLYEYDCSMNQSFTYECNILISEWKMEIGSSKGGNSFSKALPLCCALYKLHVDIWGH